MKQLLSGFLVLGLFVTSMYSMTASADVDARQDRREGRRYNRQERREMRQDNRKERQDTRQKNRKDRRKASKQNS